ncbi:hypothetical protein AVEN_116034-1 [Araneus ventricosus]|uniref:Uncharacterized protein n=1 Tax=Araneus ventricosus TaxID=182803 RepID=A0A4Y2TAU0_ARAVE|nr:hypothetical protein AVEN_116034-1 [Araneus ventricosus]
MNSLVTLTSTFEATRELFWDGPRYFELRSNEEDDTSAGTPSPNFQSTPAGGVNRDAASDLACNRLTYSADLQWKWLYKPVTLLLRSRDLTTRLSRLPYYCTLCKC